VRVGVIALSHVIKDNGALSVLNLASNNLGGWNGSPGSSSRHDTSGSTYKPSAAVNVHHTSLFHIPAGIIALANAIPNMGTMTSLNLASNMIGSEGAKHVAEAIKVSVMLRLFWYQCRAHLTNG
jgi:hypothetical protein